MYKLIRKDILIQNKNVFLLLLYNVFVFVVFSSSQYGGFVYIMGSFANAYVFITTAAYTDAKNNSDTIVNSLPILRSEVVLAKYLSIFVFALIGLGVTVSMGMLIKATPLPLHIISPSWKDIFYTLTSVCVMASLFFPLANKMRLGRGVQYINVITFMLIFFIPSYVNSYIKGHPHEVWIQVMWQLNSHSPCLLPLLCFLLALLLLALSFLITLRIYTNTEF